MRRLLRRLFDPLAAIKERRAAYRAKELEIVDTKLDDVQRHLDALSDQLAVLERRNRDDL